MIFPANGAGQGQIRLLNYMYRQSQEFDETPTFTCVWSDKMRFPTSFQDQIETFSETFDYLLRFLPEQKFRVKHEYVDKLIYNEWCKNCFKVWHGIPEYSHHPYKPDFARGGLSIALKNFHQRVPNKLVIFRDSFCEINAGASDNPLDTHRSWEYQYWQEIIEFLKQIYDVTELQYRSPISEVMYHLQTAEFCMGHSGMWQLHANALRTPMIAILQSNYYFNFGFPEYFKALYGKRGIYQNLDPFNRHSVVVLDYPPHEMLNVGFIKYLKEQAEEACNNVDFL